MKFKDMRSVTFGIAILLLLFAGFGRAPAQSLLVYIEAPDAQSSSQAGDPGAETETFNSLPLGLISTPYSSAIGTFQFSSIAKGAILAADQYGGANGSQYMAFGNQSGTSAPITINLSQPSNYLGFWFSAGDANNGITLYSNGTEFARFSTANIVSLLSGSTVTALNGTTYSSKSYYGNPNGTNEDTGEPFAYVEIVTTGTFNKVVLDNSGTTGTGFELDNMTIATGTISVPTSDVFVSDLVVVPETSRYTLWWGALVLCLVGGQRMAERYSFQRSSI